MIFKLQLNTKKEAANLHIEVAEGEKSACLAND